MSSSSDTANGRSLGSAGNPEKNCGIIVDFIYYIITIVSAWLLLSWVKSVPDTALRILLYPHKLAAEIFCHTTFFYHDGVGYIASNFTYAIGRNCMGYSLILLLYSMNACSFVRYFSGFRKLLWLAVSFGSAVLIGTFASILRIIGSIPFSGHQDFYLIHLAIGTTICLFVIMADYTTLKKLFGRIRYENQKTP